MHKDIAAKEWFYSQGMIDYPTEVNFKHINCYKMKYTGQLVFEMHLDLGINEAVEIAQITDIHFNFVSSLSDAGDEELEYTKQCRKWNAEGSSALPAIRAMDVAQYADLTVVTGDTIDYLSRGAMLLTKRYLLDRDSELIMLLGGHDITKQMQTGIADRTPLSERYEILKEIWRDDLFYVSKDVGKSIRAVCLDNSQGRFLPCQPSKLDGDILRARKENKKLLLFMHEPIATRSGSSPVQAMITMPGTDAYYDFNSEEVIGNKKDTDQATEQTYRLITENADVISGVFCGHLHSPFYTDISATYTDGGGVHNTTIPQFSAPGNPYFGCGILTRLIVK